MFAMATMAHQILAQVPNQIIMPVNGAGWDKVAGSSKHTESGGIGGADDRNAVDLNLNTPAWNTDNGKPVYASADGWVERGFNGWSGTSFGQMLLRHKNPDGTTFYCGYLHMSGITPLKATQGAYVQAGTLIGYVSNVSTDAALTAHLHFACYTYDGTKLRSQPIAAALVDAISRPAVSIYGALSINGSTVNVSPFRVARASQFQMLATFRNVGGIVKSSNYRVVLTRDAAGSDYVGLVASNGYCRETAPGGTFSQWFTKSTAFSSAVGNYWLQIYYDDCSAPYAAQKRVVGSPIAILLY
jgi:hypothetical protein